MPQPNKRARTFRRVHVRIPSGKSVIHYKKRKHDKLRCHECNKVLPGTQNFVSKLRNKLSKSERRPERPFGGVLCSACMRKRIVKRVRGEQ